MRKSTFLPALAFSLLMALQAPAQVPDPGVDQDAQAAREKLLKASDELENMQANSEQTKVAVDAMKTDLATLQASVAQLQTENAALKQQLADMQTAFDQYKSDQALARKTLIDNVAGMIAAGKSSSTKPARKKKDSPDAATDTTPPADSSPKPIPSTLLPPPDANSAPANATATPTDTPPAAPRKGYYHVVASGETLTMICEAYRENGVNVTVSEVRKANGLKADSPLKAGQKLFIPKPGASL